MSFYDDTRLAAAFYAPQAVVDSCAAPLLPLPAGRPVHWLFNELGGFLFKDLPAVRVCRQRECMDTGGPTAVCDL